MKLKTLTLDIALILETSTVGQLTSNTDVFFDAPRKQNASKVQLSNIQFIPAVADGVLIVKAETRSTDKTYETSIQFDNVLYVDAGTQYSIPVETVNGTLHIMPLRANRNDVKVRCTCLDFYWRFALYNAKDKSLIGKQPEPYVKKTDRPPVNPDQVPGVCKHIIKLADHLKLSKVLK